MPITGPIPLPQTGMSAFLDALKQGAQRRQMNAQSGLAGSESQKIQEMLPYVGQQAAADLQKTQLANKYYPQVTEAEIANKKALADWYSRRPTFGAGGSTGLKDQMQLMQQAMRDNPGMTLEKANEVTNAWLSGSPTLPDGSPTPEPSGNALAYIDRISKGRTTAAQLNQRLGGEQAESELGVLEKYANEGLAPYGDTMLGYSDRQIVDSFGNDNASQERLGKLIGSQALQMEIANVRNRLAGGQPGITTVHDFMDRSGQNIKARWPFLREKARKYASDYISKAIREGFEARKKVGVGASGAFKKTSGGTVRMRDSSGREYDIPESEAKEAEKELTRVR